MSKNSLEARLLATVHLNQLLNEGKLAELPSLSEIRLEEFQDFVGVYHALVNHYEEVLEYMQPSD